MSTNAAVSALLNPKADRGRNAFPLDNKQVYSMKAGQITPVKAFHFMPGDYFDIQASDFTLTFPMQTAPFLRGRKEFSFYSVYYNAVWSLFNQYQATRNDPKTSAFGPSPQLVEPRMPLFTLYFNCFGQWAHHIIKSNVFPLNGVFGWSTYNTWMNQNITQPHEVGFGLTPANMLPSAYYLDTLTSSDFCMPFNDDTTLGSSVKRKTFMLDVVGHERAYNWVRKLDMLGYGNLYPIFRSSENTILGMNLDWTLTNNVLPDATITALETEFQKVVAKIAKMTITNLGSSENMTTKNVNLYPICAYNLIFYHFFRNSYYDLAYSPQNYNLDFISVTNQVNNLIYTFPCRFLDVEYHQWKKDTFTGVLPDTQFGAVSSVEINGDISIPIGSDARTWRVKSSYEAGQYGAIGVNHTIVSGVEDTLAYDSYSNLIVHGHNNVSLSGSGFDVIALKRAEMLQEYRQTLMRAGNRTSDVFKALYGNGPSSEHEDDVIPRFLETFGEDIFVDPVTATANTGDSNLNGQLGDLAARGKFRGDSEHIKFNAGGNFGVILCLSYVVPTAEYNSYMLDKHILELTPEDHFIPDFENLGLEPIYSDELNCYVPADEIAVLGYAPRYHHKKSEVDKVHGAFCSLPKGEEFTGSSFGLDFFGDFNNWVSPRTDLQNRKNTQVRDFYINPSVLDNIFVRAAGADQADDQFICNTFFDFKATREMSKVGLINFV